MGIDPSMLERLVELALSQGASYAEARYHVLQGHSVGLMNGRVIAAGRESLEGVALRVVVDGGLGFASTNMLSRESLEGLVGDAIAAARLSASAIRTPVEMDDSPLGRARYSVVEKKPLKDTSLADKIAMVKERVEAASTEGLGVEIASLTVFYGELHEEKTLVTSDGGHVEASIPRAYVYYNIVAKSGGQRRARYGMIGWTGGLEGLDREDLTGNIEDDAKSLSIALTKAVAPPRGKMDVVLGPEVVGLAVHESIGHPSEADRILGREAAQAGLSYWRDYPPGSRIGSEHATVIDDPTIPGLFGFYLYDDEAVPARPRFLLRNGVVSEMLHNRETARRMGTRSNAAARARDYRSEPIVRMANTYFAPGDYTLEELIEGVKHGVYIRKFMEWNIDDYRWGARYVGLEAYRIENGRIAEPVRDPVLEITSPAFYSSVDAVGRDLRFYPGFCGKGEPMQAVPVTLGGPSIRLRGVMVR